MDQKQIGSFLKKLRTEKGLTQEQAAENLNVSSRTVSRWETGSNMPDISLLVEIAEFYDTSIPEIINGERKSKRMNDEVKDTVLQVAEYSNEEKQRSAKIVRVYFVFGMIALIINAVMNLLESNGTFWTGLLKGATFGVAFVAMILGILYTTGRMEKLRAFKMHFFGKRAEQRRRKAMYPKTFHALNRLFRAGS